MTLARWQIDALRAIESKAHYLAEMMDGYRADSPHVGQKRDEADCARGGLITAMNRHSRVEPELLPALDKWLTAEANREPDPDLSDDCTALASDCDRLYRSIQDSRGK